MYNEDSLFMAWSANTTGYNLWMNFHVNTSGPLLVPEGDDFRINDGNDVKALFASSTPRFDPNDTSDCVTVYGGWLIDTQRPGGVNDGEGAHTMLSH